MDEKFSLANYLQTEARLSHQRDELERLVTFCVADFEKSLQEILGANVDEIAIRFNSGWNDVKLTVGSQEIDVFCRESDHKLKSINNTPDILPTPSSTSLSKAISMFWDEAYAVKQDVLQL